MQFSRFHVGGNHAVHGGVLPLLFDSVFGMVIHAAGRPISRTAFLHVDYRKVTPIDTDADRDAAGSAKPRAARRSSTPNCATPTAICCAEANGLMIRLLPGQP